MKGKYDGLHVFGHEAMATVYEVHIFHEDETYAHQAAMAAFERCDQLEQDLSRFITNSDIARLNQAEAGRDVLLCEDAYECLRLARWAYDLTGGVFDVTVGRLYQCLLNEDKTPRKVSREEVEAAMACTGAHYLEFDDENYRVRKHKSDVAVDLGGIGKGYAVDKMAEELVDWDIEVALIVGGYSSTMAIGALPERDGWPVSLSMPNNVKRTLAEVVVTDHLLSGSGVKKGGHIIDPRKGVSVGGKLAAWACLPWLGAEKARQDLEDGVRVCDDPWYFSGGIADVLSTTFMVMSVNEVKAFCQKHKAIQAMMVLDSEKEGDEDILTYGPWKKEELLF